MLFQHLVTLDTSLELLSLSDFNVLYITFFLRTPCIACVYLYIVWVPLPIGTCTYTYSMYTYTLYSVQVLIQFRKLRWLLLNRPIFVVVKCHSEDSVIFVKYPTWINLLNWSESHDSISNYCYDPLFKFPSKIIFEFYSRPFKPIF